MKQLLKVIAVVAFVVATPIFFLLLAVRLSGFSAPYLKAKLADADFYTKAVTDLNKSLETPIGGITAAYVKTKAEKLIDDTEAWVKGKTATPPTLSFSDLNPQGFAEIKKIALEFKAEQEKMQKDAQAQGKSLPQQETSSFDIDKIIKSDFAIPLGEQLAPVKILYQRVVFGLPVLALILALAIAGMLFLSQTKEERFHWLGTAFLVAAFWNILPLIGVFFGFQAARGMVFDTANKDIPAVLRPLFEIIAAPIATKFIIVAAAGLVTLFVASIIFFVIAKAKPAAVKEKPRK